MVVGAIVLDAVREQRGKKAAVDVVGAVAVVFLQASQGFLGVVEGYAENEAASMFLELAVKALFAPKNSVRHLHDDKGFGYTYIKGRF
ncbi:hypothetical protein H0H87_012766 [Tephrocybe sp. NHM501043]|nr:hypothetical protein H0H87_012766 [Tephrocybe sp. NHM501043]